MQNVDSVFAGVIPALLLFGQNVDSVMKGVMNFADLALRLLRGAERAGPAGPVAPGQKRAADAKAGILRQQAEDLAAVPQGARMADGGLYPHQGQWLSLLRRKTGVAGGKRSGVPAAGPAGAMAPHQKPPHDAGVRHRGEPLQGVVGLRTGP